MFPTLRALAGVTLLAVTLSACGGGKTTTTTTTVSQPAPTTEAQREAAALPQGQMAPVPAGLNCGAVKPVWVNLHTKAYHEPGDPYYGRTKNGQYMCPSQAAAQGYHAAGSRRGETSNTDTGPSDAQAGAAGGHHKHKTHASSNY